LEDSIMKAVEGLLMVDVEGLVMEGLRGLLMEGLAGLAEEDLEGLATEALAEDLTMPAVFVTTITTRRGLGKGGHHGSAAKKTWRRGFGVLGFWHFSGERATTSRRAKYVHRAVREMDAGPLDALRANAPGAGVRWRSCGSGAGLRARYVAFFSECERQKNMARNVIDKK
jgi:hypothetical protein